MYNIIFLDLSSTFNLERDTAKEICITASIEQFILLLKRSIIIILTYILIVYDDTIFLKSQCIYNL